MHELFKIEGSLYSELAEDSLVKKGSQYQGLRQFLQNWLNEKDYITVQTSGSTGSPKSIQLKKSWMRASASATAERLQLKPQMKSLLCIPIDFIGGMMMAVRSIVVGMDIHMIDPKIDPHIEGRFDFCALIPMQIESLLAKRFNLQGLGAVIIGGAPLGPSTERQLQKTKGEFYSTFGMTETSSHVALRRIEPDESKQVFRALNGVTFSSNENEQLVIQIAYMDNLMVETNDIVSIRDKERFVWKGRADNVINSGGLKIHPEAIERKLGAYIRSQFIVHGQVNEALGKRCILIVEGDFDGELQGLRKHVAALGNSRPRAMYRVEKFNRTESDKIIRSLTGLNLVELDLI